MCIGLLQEVEKESANCSLHWNWVVHCQETEAGNNIVLYIRAHRREAGWMLNGLSLRLSPSLAVWSQSQAGNAPTW